jgi:hypothetical protein
MDLQLTPIGESVRLTPVSVLGLFWLQAHFEACTWDLVCSGNLRISRPSSLDLQRDACAAGLAVQTSAAATA